MKIGICTSVENAILVKDFIDYFEPNITAIANMSDEEFENTKKLIAENGLSAEAANSFFPADMKICGSEVDMEKIKAHTEKALKRVTELGIHICVLGSGGARKVPEDIDFAEGIRQLEEVFYAVGEIAAKYNVTVVIEPLNKNETNIINTVSEGGEIARRVNHPNIKLLADIYHMAVENEGFESIVENADIICHTHIANPDGRKYPATEEEFDYALVKKAFADAKYDLRLSVEARLNGDFVEEATKSLKLMKKIFA